MPRRSAKQTGIEVVAIVVVAIIGAFIALWNYLVETKLIWVVPVVIVGGIALQWYLKKQGEKKRILLEIEAEAKRKEAEEKRVEEILAHKAEWGEEMCQWLIEKGINTTQERVVEIMKQIDTFKVETCRNLIERKILLGMTDEMVRLSLGKPTSIDNKEVSAQTEKFRWIYGIPRRGATYISFKDGKVTNIKQ
ncbi:MAG: hypothetical protein HFACDABA_02490 [Anaerolineales bacterium]|nr:hypothetical protein [Anaerolineales bacterium]